MSWMTKDWTQGKLNALVKKLGGEAVARGILDDTVKFTVEKAKEAAAALFRLSVDWSRTTEEMVRAGCYGRANVDITEEHFPRPQTSGIVEGEYKLFHFNRNVSSDDAIREMGLKWERAGPHETLTFGERYPDKQRKYPIVGLGDPVWRRPYGDRSVVVLAGHVSDRYAYLDIWDGDWDSGCRFLARRK